MVLLTYGMTVEHNNGPHMYEYLYYMNARSSLHLVSYIFKNVFVTDKQYFDLFINYFFIENLFDVHANLP